MSSKCCPKCAAFLTDPTGSCRICGYDPTASGTQPSQFDPHPQPPQADTQKSKTKKGLVGVTSVAVAVVAAVAIAGAAIFVGTSLLADDDHGNHPLSAVCAGEGEPAAAAYDPASGASGILELRHSDGKWNSNDTTAVAAIDLVACRTQGETHFRSLGCQGRVGMGSGEIVTYSAELYRITIEAREARTGEVVAEEHVTPPNECPGEDGILVLDVRSKKHRIVPTAEADSVVSSFQDPSPAGDDDTDRDATEEASG